MKKLVGALLLLLVGFSGKAQEEKKQFIHKGILRAQATISPGMMTHISKQGIITYPSFTISLHGNLEYYIADNISIRGDGYYYLQEKHTLQGNPFQFNHSIFSGASYHFKTKNHFDPYLAFEPGISITSGFKGCWYDPFQTPYSCLEGETTLNPLLSSALGFNLYFQKWFHVFGQARYIYGKYLSNAPNPLSLSELRFSFGLGFNLTLIKLKN